MTKQTFLLVGMLVCVIALAILIPIRSQSDDDYEAALNSYAVLNYNLGRKVSREAMTRYIHENVDSLFVLDSAMVDLKHIESEVLDELVEAKNKENE